ncbi:CRISPR-associated endonuclease Cas3'' [Salinisphaera hydrothermalis]|uniref:CRISPR-associated endonuclease Cas3'' n=1 Tax=Salinisphaera hydrothermalis TaxID=563188 RepID=UPI0033404F2C
MIQIFPMYYAHSTERADQRDWQTLADHLRAVADIAAEHGAAFGCDQFAKALGLLHDLGKYSDAFQKRLTGTRHAVDHATAGAVEAKNRYGSNLGTLMAYAIAGHHTGLANGRALGQRRPLVQRLAADIEPINSQWTVEVSLPDIGTPPLKSVRERAFFQYAFFCRMLFSCLVDADFIETENFYAQLENKPRTRGARPSLITLKTQLDSHLASFKSDGPVNAKRREILDAVRGRASDQPGHFSLTVPTGGGKTLTSLAFALDHAVAHDKRRVIYVIPFTSIVEQNAAVFRNALDPYGADAVLEHHGSFDAQNIDALADSEPGTWDKLKRDSENWDAPVVVTTAVQFFESLFAAKTSRCRKLHNIANSVVILDEAQTLPLGLLRPTLAALDELQLNYGTTVVYCTATQPSLTGTHCGALPEALEGVRELAPEPARLFDAFKRVQIRHIGTQSDEAIVDRLAEAEQILCIVNNRRHARYLFDQVAECDGARHLTTAMYANHRREVLADIRQRLTEGLPCRVIATSLIEAGVDIDFPTVLRAEAGLDAIAQAAGRCNREGKRALADSLVEVFAVASDDWSPPPELKAFAQIMGEILRQHPEADPLSPEIMQRYFDMLYWQQGDDGLDRCAIMKSLQNASIDGLPFEKIEADYRLIENNQRAVIIPHGDAKDALRDLEYAEHVGGLARRLRPYTVQVPQAGFNALEQVGAVTTIRPEEFGDEFVVLMNTDLYSPESGLNWSEPTFMKAESLTW